MPNNLTPEQSSQLNYEGELTLEALSIIDTYRKLCFNKSATSRQIKRTYNKLLRFIRFPYVRELFKLKLLEEGVTPESLAKDINKGRNAENGVYYEGDEVAREPNWSARQKFVQLACEIFEVLKYSSKTEVFDNSSHLHITNLQGEALIDEARRRGIPLPEPIARRLNKRE